MSPVVSRETRRTHDGESWKKITKLSARSGRFSIEMPSYMHDVLGFKDVGSETLEGINKAFENAWKEYGERIKSYRKVILYSYKVNAIVWEGDGISNFGAVSFRREDMHFQKNHTALSLWYDVGFETRNPHDKNPTYMNLDKNRSITTPSGFEVLDWTQNIQDFFYNLNRELQKLIIKSCSFLDKSDKLVELIEQLGSGVPLLPVQIEDADLAHNEMICGGCGMIINKHSKKCPFCTREIQEEI